MKHILILSIAVFLSTSVFSQQPNDEEMKKSNAFLRFDPSEVNMGNIDVNKVDEKTGDIEIYIYNDGAKPLIISQVTACCGTNVKEWPRQPISPGQKGTIKVHFRVEPRPHRISRLVTVNSNAANGTVLKIAILGEIIVPKKSNEIQL